jgi:uncharacterized protein (DUF2235 family)
MTTFGGRNLIVLSDGTGNSAAKSAKTNVWRLYQALQHVPTAVNRDSQDTLEVRV